MSLIAKRFDTLTKETNLGTADLRSIASSDVLNVDFNSDKAAELKESMENFANKADEKIKDALDVIKNGKAELDVATRDVKGLFSKVKDLSSLPSKEIDKRISGLLKGNSALGAAFSSGLNKGCKDKAAGFGGIGKPFDLSMNCNGKDKKSNSKCNNGGFSDILNKLTNGAFQGTVSDLNNALASLMSLSLYGYDLNMCGVFGALSSGVSDLGVLNRGAAGVLTALNSTRNTSGLFDLTSATAGLAPLLEAPDGLRNAISGFKLPDDIKEFDMTSFGDRFEGSLELLNDKWKSSSFDGMMSLSQFDTSANSQLGDSYSVKLMGNSINDEYLNDAPSDDDTFFAGAVSSYDDNSFDMSLYT